MRLGIVGGALQGMEVAYLARKAGYETVVIDRWDKAPAFSLADEHAVLDAVNDPEALRILEDCDAVMPANEDLETLERLVNLLRDGPPLIFDLQAFRLSRSKALSNKLFRSLDVPMPATWPESGFPVIVKPSEESGSVGVSKANNEAQLRRSLDRARQYGEGVVVQEFISGRSVSLEVIGNGERFIPLVTTEVHFDSVYDCKMVTTPVEMDFDDQQFRDASLQVASSLSLRGIMDVEAMISGRTAKLIEIDARFPSQTPTAVYHSTGINMVRMLVDLFTSGSMDVPDVPCSRTVIYEHLMVEDGSVHFRGEDGLPRHPDMVVMPGLFGSDEAITDYRPDLDSWAATLIFTGRDRSEVLRKRRRALRNVMASVQSVCRPRQAVEVRSP
jgi:pyrrolysine biosynthesis protein PylC